MKTNIIVMIITLSIVSGISYGASDKLIMKDAATGKTTNSNKITKNNDVFQRLRAYAECVLTLPDKWKFKMDTKKYGENSGWCAENIKNDDWQYISILTPWESQGYDKYDGYAWYRVKFSINDVDRNCKYFLAFQQVDEGLALWVNGRFMGEHSNVQAWNRLRVFQINGLKTGTNTIAVRVYDSGLLGGLCGPVKLFKMKKNIKRPLALIAPDHISEELRKWIKWAGSLNGVEADVISWHGFASEKFNPAAYAAIWVHDDSSTLHPVERKPAVAAKLKQYILEGGGVLLSGGAWSLVNALGLEKVKASFSGGHAAISYGFSPLKDHPVFRGIPREMANGNKSIITIKTNGKKYNRIDVAYRPKKGQIPKNGRIIGVGFHWRQPVAVVWDYGAGRVLALGSGCQFDVPFNTGRASINLKKIVSNALLYISSPFSPNARLSSKTLADISKKSNISVSRPVFKSAPSLICWDAGVNNRLQPDAHPDPANSSEANSIDIVMAANEYEPCHLGLALSSKASRGENLRISITRPALGEDSLEVTWNRTGFVNPLYIEDVLLPPGELRIKPSETKGVWITVHAPDKAKPGIYKGSISIKNASATLCSIPLNVKVADFALPMKQNLNTGLFALTFAKHKTLQCSQIKVGLFTPDRESFFKKMFVNFSKHRVSPSTPMPERDREYFLNKRNFLDTANKDRLYNWIDYIHSLNMKINCVSPYIYNTSNKHIERYINTVGTWLNKKNNLWQESYIRFGDEDDQFGERGRQRCLNVLKWGKYVHERFPKWRVLFTVVGRSVENAKIAAPEVNIWCIGEPLTLLKDAKWGPFLQDEMKKGKEIWFYQHDSLSLENDLREVSLRLWFCRFYGANGINLWSTMWYHGGGDGVGVSRTDETFSISNISSSAGVLFWPGEHKVFNSIRWERLRDGIEEWELLNMLSQHNPKLERKFLKQLFDREDQEFNMAQARAKLFNMCKDVLK